jgi:hypothetical protein
MPIGCPEQTIFSSFGRTMALHEENCADGPSNAINAMPIMDYYSEIGCTDLKSNNTQRIKNILRQAA